MKFRTFGYFIKEGMASLGRNSLMSLASIGSVASALIILGIFLIITLNFNFIVDTVESQVEITAYLDDSLMDEEISRIGRELIQVHGVREVTFVSREQALKEFREQLGDKEGLLAAMEKDNPLPNSYRIKTQNPEVVKDVANMIGRIEGIDEVKYGKEIVDKLFKITGIIRFVGIGVMAVLSIISIFIISNTIKLTVYARRREIEIMKYIGATDWFIRWPFLIEGMVLGFLGSLIAVGVLNVAYYYLFNFVVLNIPIITLLPFDVFLYDLSIWFLGIGTFIGTVGSGISIRRFLRV
ncbi:Cell division protein FtsX [Koleobacter methoxysyntrophicus]|jgi:cell division transport system permease protein|uniref:Cell division protein FtsX n=1 Tax=Koleobacter methoxysyntrophicus TaxID=2751313 RepID=A0A8A0RR56_9FIRM|nr:permease-like cell division protein FtsX [Koleobacter methoxysyntrophicus]QSQ10372.1 Cell division protein FtsX [Koleobacter methoxysyntrophicus]